MTNTKFVSVIPDHNKPALSKGQKQFNLLIKQIEKRRMQLGLWETVTPTFQKRYTNDLLPLEQMFIDLQIQLVHYLDQACEQKDLNKKERHKVSALITDLTGGLVCENEELKAIYNKHSKTDYDSETAAEINGMKSMLETMLDVELGDNLEIDSPEALLRHAHAHMQQRQAEEAAAIEAQQTHRAKPKKSPKQIAAEARAQEEQAKISLSIREVYRKLASALHPDREADPKERERKTKLMQSVNEAYSKNNLLHLLELQLELEHIDQNSINNLSEDRLKHYNKILKEQVHELNLEIKYVENRFRHSYRMDPFISLSPRTVLKILAEDIASLQGSIQSLKNDLISFTEIKQLKLWLKTLRVRQTRSSFEPFPF